MKHAITFDLPEEVQELGRVYHANHAWAAIDAALGIIRSHIKYGNGGAEEALQDVQMELSEAQRRLE